MTYFHRARGGHGPLGPPPRIRYWYGPIQAVGYIEEGAPRKVTDTQSGSQNHQPMILVTGAYLRHCIVQCRSGSSRVKAVTLTWPVVAVVWYRQVVQQYQGCARFGEIWLFFTEQVFTFPLSVADLRGAPGTPPGGSKFFHFHAVFGRKNRLAHPLWELAPPPGENPGSATDCNTMRKAIKAHKNLHTN